MNIEGNTLYSYGILGTIIAKLDARENKDDLTKNTLRDLRNVRIHLMYLQNNLEMCQYRLNKAELENDKNDMILTSYQRRLKSMEKELKEIKNVLYDSI